jgi:ribonuclease P protein component
MLKKPNRVRKNADFNKIFREGKKINTDFLLLKVAENNNDKSRFGFVVSKKVSKNSTTRNKIKRILREIIRKRETEIRGGFDIVIIIKKDFSKIKFSEIEKFVWSTLEQSSLLGNSPK